METLALILAGGRGSRLDILSERRSKPAVPFAGKFRIIDFALSNCSNSGIFNIAILTQYLPLSLNEHIGVGKPWDLDRRDGGVTLLQPHNYWYEGTADAVLKNIEFIRRNNPEYVLILSGDHIYKMDYRKMLKTHKDNNADLTIAAKIVPIEEADRFGILETDDTGRITKFIEKPKKPQSNKASMGIYIFSTDVLLEALETLHQREFDFGHHVIPKLIETHNVFVHEYHDYWKDVGTYDSYLETSLELNHSTLDLDLYDPIWKIYTKSEDLPPVRVGSKSTIVDSLISNGSIIKGHVINSVLSPGVVVEEGAWVIDSVLLNNVRIGKGAKVHRTILDKKCEVGDNTIIGHGNDYTPNQDRPEVLSSGINVAGKSVKIPANRVIERNVRIFPSFKGTLDKVVKSGSTLK